MFENVFGIHEQALLLQGQRVGILATNLANADTPNYKARDIDFSAVLSRKRCGAAAAQRHRRRAHHAERPARRLPPT